MKHKYIMLQLFSEDATAQAAASDATKASDAKTSDTKASDSKPGDANDSKKDDTDVPKYTDKDVDDILNKKFAKWQEKQQKAVAEAEKLANMNATQKAEYEKEQLKKELDELKRQNSLSEMTKTARKMLSDDGINAPDELLSVMVTTDAEETKAAVDAFAKAFKDAVEAAVKDRLKGEPPRKGTGGAASMTKDQILAIKDPELRQKKMLENRHLFNF
ncbi:MAG: DUF4355 domain-containing protein [Erysipelotrichaceae bacterium]|nr:DUF4355 domain-containing protein [Erysipelotrichaceae bacterium]